MDIFDEMGKRLGNVGQRTKDAAESARLNSLVSEQEKKIKTICQELGKLYLSLHGPEDCEPALADYVKEAGECYQKIADLREKIRVLKGLRQCPHCGAQIPAGTAYCGSCGKRVDEAPSRRITQSAAASAEVFCGKDLCSVPPAVLRFWLPRLPAPGSRSLRLPPLPVRSLPFRSRNPGPAPFLPCRKDLLKILFLPRSRCRTAVRTAGDL